MRALILSIALAPALSTAQQPAQPPTPVPPAGADWQHVQALSFATPVHLSLRTANIRCDVTSVDTEALHCGHGKTATFQRAEIKSIKLVRRTRSTLLGMAIGAGSGIAIGYAIPASTSYQCTANPLTCVLEGPSAYSVAANPKTGHVVTGFGIGIAAGTLAGFLTDFTRSTVYKAP
jgi:hypothetical protein